MFNESPPDDDLFELLDNSRRRQLLSHLLDAGGEADLAELSRRIAANEANATVGTLEGDPASVYRTLRETHVPALARSGLVDYDETDGVVSLGDRGDEVAAVLTDTTERRRRWAVRYLFVALCLGSALFASESRLVAVPPGVVTVATLGGAATFLSLAGLQYYRSQNRGDGDPPLGGAIG